MGCTHLQDYAQFEGSVQEAMRLLAPYQEALEKSHQQRTAADIEKLVALLRTVSYPCLTPSVFVTRSRRQAAMCLGSCQKR